MGKYGSGLSYSDVCKLELEEMEEILDEYDILEEDRSKLRSMLKEAYYQASRLAANGRALEGIINDHKIKVNLLEYIKRANIEERKFPFNVDDDDEDEEFEEIDTEDY